MPTDREVALQRLPQYLIFDRSKYLIFDLSKPRMFDLSKHIKFTSKIVIKKQKNEQFNYRNRF